MRKLIAALTVVGLGLTTFGALAPRPERRHRRAPASPRRRRPRPPHELPNPLEDKRRELKETAPSRRSSPARAQPQERNGSTVVKVGETSERGRRQRPRRAATSTSSSRTRAPTACSRCSSSSATSATRTTPTRTPTRTRPGRPASTARSTTRSPSPTARSTTPRIWQPDYSQDYFQNLYFGTGRGVESLKTYYEKQSSGRYSVDGDATAWVTVPYNEARYGRSNGFPCDDVVCDNTWNLVEDGMNAWVAAQEAAGLTPGTDQGRAGHLRRRTTATTSTATATSTSPTATSTTCRSCTPVATRPTATRSRARTPSGATAGTPSSPTPASPARRTTRSAASQVGDTGIWAGDYTIQPENGGLSTIAHEYGHDLGLPDHYDTAGGQNGVEWWNLMAQSRLSAKGEPIGTRAGDLSAWDKLQLGWLDYEVTVAGQTRTLDLGPHEYNSPKAQAVVARPAREDRDVRVRRTVRRRTACGGRAAVTTSSNSMTRDGRPHRARPPRRSTSRPATTSRRTSTTCTCRRPPTAAPRGRASTAPSTASRSSATAATTRPSPARPEASGSTCTSASTPTPARRCSCGSSTAPTVAWPPTASSPTRSSSPPTVHRWSQRRRGRRRGLDARRVHVDHRHRDRRLRELLHRVAPQLRVLRQVPEDRSVQLRLRQHEAGLRGALQLHAGPAHLVLGHLAGRQQHERAPGPGVDPADRLAPARRSST